MTASNQARSDRSRTEWRGRQQSPDRFPPMLSSGPFLQRAFIGYVALAHLLGEAALVGVVADRKPGYGPAQREASPASVILLLRP
jgi:hypothetical protein